MQYLISPIYRYEKQTLLPSSFTAYLHLMLLSAFDSCIQSTAIFKQNGLSNSAILSLYRDHQGVIWIGSCDGLNIFDGTNIHVYNPVNPTKAPLSGNLINDIMETEKDVLWIQTNYGLDRLDTKLQTSKKLYGV